MTALIFIWKYKKIFGVLLLTALVVGYVAKLSHEAREAEKEAKNAQMEANRQAQQVEGLKVIINSNSIAGEVENEKKQANQQQVNSNASNAAFSNSIQRGSNSFSNNRSAVNDRYCQQFPDDCR